MKLNLGCGEDWRKLEGFDGVDSVDFGQKHIIDIERDGLRTIPDDSIDEIRAWNFLEHISMDREIFVMNEMWRVLKVGGLVHIKVPKFPHYNAVVDPTHKSFWVTRKFTNYYCGNRPRNAKYFDHKGTELRKWAVANDGEGNYRLEQDHCSIDIWIQK